MKKTNPILILSVLTALNLGLIAPSARAAVRTWSGAGTDNTWTNTANWGGTAPANGDILLFSGSTQTSSTNNYAALSVNGLSFAAGGFSLAGNLMTLNGAFTNSAGVNIVGQGVNVTANNIPWPIAAGSELRLAGVFTNSSSANPLATLGSGGNVRITSTNFLSNRFFTLTSGGVIIDGGNVITGDGFRLQPPSGSTAVFQLTNGGSLMLNVGANVRLCQTATGGSSRVDMSPGSTLNLYITSGGGAGDLFVGEAASTTTVFNQNGGLVEFTGNGDNRVAFANASASANGTYNLNGGVLWTASIIQVNAGSPGGTFNFNGGTLKALSNSPSFFQGVQNANIQAGGAIIDTTNLNVTIGESLPGAGGLTKLGTGVLTLSGNDTYTGTTTVSNGTLVTSAASYQGGGALTVAAGGNLTITNFSGTALLARSLNLGSSVTNSVTLNLGSSPSPNGNPQLATTNLNGTGVALINILGSSFSPGMYPLIAYTNITGAASLQIGSLPLGVSGTLVLSNNMVNLAVSYVPKNLEWSGAVSANWDTTTFNWNDLNNGGNPTNYAQSGGSGDAVTFDDNGGSNPNVSLNSTLTPSQITFNNNGVLYDLTGTGTIAGNVNVTKGGFQTIIMGTSNTYSGGTILNAGVINVATNSALGTGGVTLNLGTLSSDGTTPRTLPNMVTQNANTGVILGDTVNTGTLTISGGLNLAGGARTLNFNSDVNITGVLTNGGIGTKTGPGSLIVSGPGLINAQTTQTAGNTIINGGTLVQTGDGWRMQDTLTGSTMDFAVTNGGSFIMTNLVGGNFRLGLAGEDTSTSYILDVAGRMVVYAAGNPAGVGQVYLGIAAQKATLNLWPGGNLSCAEVTSGGTCVSEVDCYGGTLTPTYSSTTFFQGVTNAYIQNGGLTVDTTNLTITIAQPLLAAGSGGLTKVGTGTLTLTGSNTYSGITTVNAGKLILTPPHAATGGTLVNANATLAFLQSSPPATVDLPSVTIGGGANSALEAQLSVTNAPVAIITNLVLNGSVAVNVSGSLGVGQFPLFGYGTISGSGGLTLGSIPLGTTAHLVTNVPNSTIDLVVSSIAQTTWTGASNGNWDTTTTNWSFLGTPIAYAQNANVLFNDTASTPAVTLTTALAPSTMVVSNTGLAYTFSGSGSLSGNMTLVKDGTNTATLSNANSYTGNTTVKNGRLTLGNSTALGSGSGTVTVQNGASLDLAGNAPGLQPLILGGSGAGTNGALISDTVDQNNALRAVTLTTNTTICANNLIGIRTAAETDPGFNGNDFKLIKIGASALNLNGGEANVAGTNVWNSNLADIDVQQGILSFERRMTMGVPTNTITVEAGAMLKCYSLNTNVLPLQTKPIHLKDASLASDGATVGDFIPLGCPILVDAGSNFITTLPGGGTGGSLFVLEGAISGAGSVYYSGTNQLAGTNTYTGNTVITAGVLQLIGTGSIANSTAVAVQSNCVLDVSQVSPWTLGSGQALGGSGTVNGSVQVNGLLMPGSGTGTLTVNGNLTLNGNLLFEVNKSLAQSNDIASVSGSLSNAGSGTLTVTNLGPALAAGDRFVLFNQPVSGGNTLTVAGAGAAWTNNLAVDGSITALTVAPTVNTNSAPITYSISGGSLNLGWPADHTGWRLQTQTNSLSSGLQTNWSTVANSTLTNAMSFPLSPANPCVFFRLVYP